MDDDRALRWTFDTAADAYDAARPDYPAELFDDLVTETGLAHGAAVLEVGCGTGKATRPLLERGYRVMCVELGENLVEVARRRLAGFAFEASVSPFETWSGPPSSFDLVYAATAWHWVDGDTAYPAAHRLLRPGGHLALWSAEHAFPDGYDPFFRDIQFVYEEIGESRDGEWPPRRPDEVPDRSADILSTGLFDHVAAHRYVWEIRYTADEYIALLSTFSGHIAMGAPEREYLFEQIRRRVDERPDGRVRRHWLAILDVARRREM